MVQNERHVSPKRRIGPGVLVFAALLATFVVQAESIEQATRGLIALPHLVRRTAPEVRWQGRLPRGAAVEIKGINGAIVATRASGQAVDVRATRTGRRGDPAGVRIAVVEHAGGVTICAIYPAADGGPPETCGPGDEPRAQVRQEDVRVRFEVAVPRGVRLVATTVNGDLDAHGLDSPLALTTVNGAASFSTTAYGQARSVNGPIRAVMGAADWQGTLSLETVNGSITVDLPSDLDADLDARALNGETSTAFPIARLETRRDALRARVGDGGRTLRLQTVNGSIRLRRR
jgi:hypothetical protein